jgi:hypothetical protein
MPQKRAKSALSSGVVVTVPHPARIRLSRIRQQQEDKLQNVNIAHRFRQ